MPPQAPDTLPANFNAWDQAPDTLPANFNGFDSQSQAGLADHTIAEMGAHPQGVRQWLRDLESDLRYGGEQTAVGRALKSVGYQGAESLGSMEGTAGKTLVSPLTGLVHIATGYADVAKGKLGQGAGEIGSGFLETAEIPSMFIAPEASELAATAPRAAKSAIWFLPSNRAARAGKLFASVAEDAGSVPVELNNSGQAASRLLDWQAKINPGSVVNKYLQRITSPKKGPMTYSEARDWYSVLGNLSAEESSKLPDVVKRDLTTMVQGLKQDIGDAADQVGRAADYYKAMGDYHKAKKLSDWWEKYGPIVKKTAVGSAVTGAVGVPLARGGMRLYDLMSSK